MSGIISDNVLKQSGLIKAPAGGSWTFLAKSTASSSANISFTSGIDSTYGVYVFTFKNILPATDGQHWTFNVSIDSGSNYNIAKTGAGIDAYHNEAGNAQNVRYNSNYTGSQTTGHIQMVENVGSGSDEGLSGYFYLFNPSSTVFVKHFLTTTAMYQLNDYEVNAFTGGYANTTSAVDAVQFKFASGNIASGDICLYGITT